MRTHTEAYTKTIINGHILKDEAIKANYDGQQLAIDLYNNGKHIFTKLDNNDITNILAQRAHALPLEQRLTRDFGIKKRVRRQTNKKVTKKKPGKRKTLKR